jgi:hypothetical protein
MPKLPGRISIAALMVLAGFINPLVNRAAAQCGDTSVTCLAGHIDNFATGDGPEASAPSATLLAAMQTGSTPPLNEFDSDAIDVRIGHTFVGCWPANCAAGAILTFHVRGTSGSTDTDEIILGVNATPVYGVLFNTLQALRTNGTDVSWDPGDEATFVLDLANLPPGLGGGPDIRASLQGGDLDVLIDDDSSVDYLQLYVRVNATPAGASTWGSIKGIYR